MPANMKKSGMSYKKGGSKKMYGGTMKKKMYGGSKKKMMKGGSNAKMPKSVYKKGSELGAMSVKAGRDSNYGITKTDIILGAQKNDKMYGGMANPNKDKMMMYGGSMYKKMMKMMGGPMMNEKGMKVPGMMKAGCGLNKMPGGGFMRSMDLPMAQKGTGFGKKVVNLFKKRFGKKEGTMTDIRGNVVNPNKIIDDVNVDKLLLKGTGRDGSSIFKIGPDGKVMNQSDNVMPFSETLIKKILNAKKPK